MPEYVWIFIIIGGFLVIGLLAFAIFKRGLKIGNSESNWSIDIPGPKTKVLKEKNGERVFIEMNKVMYFSEKKAELKTKQNLLLVNFTTRAMDYTISKLDSFLYEVDEVFQKYVENDPNSDLLDKTIGVVTGNLRRKLIEDILQPSFINNGFYDYKTLSSTGEVAETRDWKDYLIERKQTVESYIKHNIRNKMPAKEHTEKLIKNILTGELHDRLFNLIDDIYDKYWHLHHQIKEANDNILAELVKLQDELKKED